MQSFLRRKKTTKNAGRKEDALVEGWPSSKLASKGCSKPLARFIFHNDDDDDGDDDDDDDDDDDNGTMASQQAKAAPRCWLALCRSNLTYSGQCNLSILSDHFVQANGIFIFLMEFVYFPKYLQSFPQPFKFIQGISWP